MVTFKKLKIREEGTTYEFLCIFLREFNEKSFKKERKIKRVFGIINDVFFSIRKIIIKILYTKLIFRTNKNLFYYIYIFVLKFFYYSLK